jgi:molybdenum cofactor cytidylyltransferase
VIFGLIPAGGQSRRMGRPKLLLPLGKRTILDHVIATIQEAGIERILVVATATAPELSTVAEAAGATVLTLPDPTPDMRATVQIGLRWIEQIWGPADDDCWLLAPADHPALEATVIFQLLAAERAGAEHSVFVPTHDGRRGHPTLVRWRHARAIPALPAGEGLNAFFRQLVREVREIPMESPGVLTDLDTPEDYAQLLRDGGYNSMP